MSFARAIAQHRFAERTAMKHRPESTFGTVNADVLALKDATYKRVNFCNVIRESAWAS